MAITATARTEVIQLVVAMFNGAPGASVLSDLVTSLGNGTVKQLASNLEKLAVFNGIYPTFLTDQEFADRFLNNLVGAEVASADKASYATTLVAKLLAGASRSSVIIDSINLLKGVDSTNTQWIKGATLFNNKVAVATYYTVDKQLSGSTLAELQNVIASVTSSADSVTTAKASVDSTGSIGLPFTLTTGIDNFPGTAGNDTFVASPAAGFDTFTALDSINGGKGNDALTVAAVAALTIPAGAKVIDVETAALASTTTIVADTSGWTGLTQLNLTSGTGTTATAAATTNVTEASSVAVTTITGGKDVSVTHSTAGVVTVNSAAGAVNITNTFVGGATNVGGNTVALQTKGTVNVAAKGDIVVTGGTSMIATDTEATAYTARVANAAASTAANALSSTATLQAATGLVVTGVNTMAAAVAAAATPTANFTATTTALNGGFVTLAQKTAIDTAYNVAFAAVGGTAALAQAAALAVYTPIQTAAASANVTAGVTGANNLATQTAATALVTLDAIPARTITNLANTGLTSATVTGNYGGTTTITDTSSGVNQLTTVTLDNSAPATLTGNALTNVSVSNVVGTTGAVTVTNNAVGHTQNLTLSQVGTASATAPAFFVFTDAAATTLNVVSNGTTNVATLTAAAATAVNISGAGALQMTSTVTNGTGASTFAANAVINATNSSGANTVSVAAGQSYLGGSGADVVYAAAGLQTAAVSGGAGTADRLIVTNVANIAVNTLGTGSALFKDFEILQNATGGVIDLSTTLLGNTFTSVAFKTPSAATTALSQGTINGLNATQANAVTISNAANLTTGYTLGVTGASNVGQLDTVTVSAGAALGTLDVVGVETLNITPTAGTSFNMSANSTALSAINITGGSSAVYISGEAVALNPNTVIDASKGTGKAMLNIISATGNGAKLMGSATANNLLTSNNSSSVLVGGAGNDILRGGNGNDTITAGNGNNTVVTGNGVNSVTLGNGMNNVTGGTGVDTITVGTGNNWIGTGGALDVINLGAHTLGNVHTIDLAGAGRTVANVVTVNGFNSGVDKINLSGVGGASLDTLTLTNATTQAAMLAPVTDVTSVATLADVYTALASGTGLNNTAGKEFAASSAAAGGLVARTVVYTTGAAAGTYLVINDDTAAFAAADDIVIKLTGKTTVAAGDIIAAGTAFSVTPIQAFTATVGTDNFVGGDLADTFAAKFSNADDANTFVAADVMTGGAGTDVLTIANSTTAAATTLVDADFANKSLIEELVISTTTTGAQSITVGTNYDDGFNKLTTTSTSGAITIVATNVTTAGSFIPTTSLTGGNIIVTADTASVVAQTITATVGSGAAVGSPAVTSTIAVTGGAGVDTITVNSGNANVAGTGTVAITGGAGADVISLGFGTGVTTITLDAIAVAGNVAGADVITGFTVTAGADVIRATDAAYAWFNGATDGAVVLATGANMDALHAASNNFTVGTISTNVATHTVATYLAGGSTIAQLEGTIATALGTATNANFANTDFVLVAIDDGVSTMIVRVVSAADGNAIGDAEISLIGIISGLADATTLAAANFTFA